MNHSLYEKYRLQYLKEAIEASDKTTREIYRALTEIPPPGRFSFHKHEKLRAVNDLLGTFADRRHWPLDIILSHLGIDAEELKNI